MRKLSLNFTNQSLKDEDILGLKELLTNYLKLTFYQIEITLTGNHLSSLGGKYLAEFLKKNKKLTRLELTLTENGIGNKGLSYVTRVLTK